MKTTRTILNISAIILVYSAFLTSCNKSDSPSAPDDNGPIITVVGTPNGEMTTASIGASGGTLNSADGKLTITIPAGALTSATDISVQPITNEAPLGLGSGYRLQPEGTAFAIPAILTFHYDEEILKGSMADLLWIVSQVSDKSWNALLSSAVDTIAKTVSVTTAHFSDYMLGRFIDFTLKPSSPLVLKGQSIQLAVSAFLPDEKVEELAPLIPAILTTVADHETDILAPINNLYFQRGMRIKIKQWSLNGVAAPVSNSNGSLSISDKSATYTAPGQIPSTNPVNVSVQLEGKEKESGSKVFLFSLHSHITVIGSSLYISLIIDGKKIDYTQYGFNTEVPPDPTNYSQVICGTTDNKFEILASMVNTSIGSDSIFEFAFDNPWETTRILIGSNKNGHDRCAFSPKTGIQYDMNYTQRTRNQDNTCDMQSFCSNITTTLITYSGPNSVVRGSFSGTFYEDKPGYSNLCTMPDLHTIQGEFLLKMAY
jgi:hypothetical protein